MFPALRAAAERKRRVPPYYYTARRKPRRLTETERRAGLRHDYRGTETFISVYEPPESVVGRRAQRISGAVFPGTCRRRCRWSARTISTWSPIRRCR